MPRGSGWCGWKRWPRKRRAISRARWRSRAPRSMPAEFARARAALAPFAAAPTQRVALLMAEIERTEHGDSGKARAWTLRAVRARHDSAWTADGYVSDRWRPVSPVTGRLDAFQWQTPVASLPSDKGTTIESSPFEEAMLAAPSPRRDVAVTEVPAEPPRELQAQIPAEVKAEPAAQDNSPPTTTAEPVALPAPPPAAPPQAAPQAIIAAARTRTAGRRTGTLVPFPRRLRQGRQRAGRDPDSPPARRSRDRRRGAER